MEVWLSMHGRNLGEIPPIRSRRDGIRVEAIDHNIEKPWPATDQNPGMEIEYGLFTISKPIDEISPTLDRALVTNELLDQWLLEFWLGPAKEDPFFTIQLKNAHIWAIRVEMGNDNDEADPMPKEHVSFGYGQVVRQWHESGADAPRMR